MNRREFFAGSTGALTALAGGSAYSQRAPDVVYVPTPQEVVDAMLNLAKVKRDDLVYDLGCGDGRVVVTAAKRFGARGVGVDIDPERVADANDNVRKNGVQSRVRIVQGDLFEQDLSQASVVALYLLPALNLKLRPKLWSECKPGTRVVSHAFDMGDWAPEQRMMVKNSAVFYWTIPPR